MQSLKYLLKNLTLLNFILITLCVTFAYYTLFPLLKAEVKFTPPAIKKVAAENKAEVPENDVPSPNDYMVVAEQNLFHPERKIPVEKPPAPPLPKPEFVLSGTLLAGDLSLAYMEDKKAPQSTPGRGKRVAALRKGEALSGFALRDVEADRVVMIRGEETITVYLNDASSPKTRETAATSQRPPAPGPQPPPGQPLPAQAPVSVRQPGAAAAISRPSPSTAQQPPAPRPRPSRLRRANSDAE